MPSIVKEAVITPPTSPPLPPEKAPRGRKKSFRILLPLAFLLVLGAGILLGVLCRSGEQEDESEFSHLPSFITVALIRKGGASRSGEKLEAVRNIAVHYVGNPGTSAFANRNYFDDPASSVSSHFIVGLEGEILLCVPLDEKSSATNERNRDTVSVEVCHPDEGGEFSEKTYESLVRLLAYLCDTYDLTEEDLIRHYDVTGKMCPRYYVEHPEAWGKTQIGRGGRPAGKNTEREL